MKKIILPLTMLLLSNSVSANDDNYKAALGYDTVVDFINEYSQKDMYSRDELINMFAKTSIKKSVLKQSNNQPEKKLTWESYRNKVVSQKKIDFGIQFLNDNILKLQKAENEFGVPKEIITAIIGIESFYGKYKGDNKALDAISTMAFEGSERRRKFFKKELEAFLDNSYYSNLNPLDEHSSWAGAFGYPQFISSSIKAYGIDYDDDKIIDLNNSVDDSIGSVANYLNKNGWIKNNYIAEEVSVKNPDTLDMKGLSLKYTISELSKKGVEINRSMRKTKNAKIFSLNDSNKDLFFIGYDNFKAITMYNRSNLYAMAVFTLANKIKGSEVI